MGFKKDDSGSLPKSSFRNCLVVFLPVSTKRGTVQFALFLFSKNYLNILKFIEQGIDLIRY
jgi:hypothetical protein